MVFEPSENMVRARALVYKNTHTPISKSSANYKCVSYFYSCAASSKLTISSRSGIFGPDQRSRPRVRLDVKTKE